MVVYYAVVTTSVYSVAPAFPFLVYFFYSLTTQKDDPLLTTTVLTL